MPSSKKRRRRERQHKTLTHQEWVALKEWWGGCAYCGRTDRPLTRDCILPLRGHGVYQVWNVVPACLPCNCAKSGKNVFNWMRQKGYDGDRFEARCQAWWRHWVDTPSRRQRERALRQRTDQEA